MIRVKEFYFTYGWMGYGLQVTIIPLEGEDKEWSIKFSTSDMHLRYEKNVPDIFLEYSAHYENKRENSETLQVCFKLGEGLVKVNKNWVEIYPDSKENSHRIFNRFIGTESVKSLNKLIDMLNSLSA